MWLLRWIDKELRRDQLFMTPKVWLKILTKCYRFRDNCKKINHLAQQLTIEEQGDRSWGKIKQE